jgi:hypothetical protein
MPGKINPVAHNHAPTTANKLGKFFILYGPAIYVQCAHAFYLLKMDGI